MKNHHPVEEKFPLLLLYVEENGKKSDFPQRVVFADKGRGKEVIKGAATIITQWPAQVTSCWFTSISIAFTFMLLTFVIFMATLHPLLNPIHPRCTRDLKNYHGNKIIHVVKQGSEWNSKQLDILKFIADTYPQFEINNIIIDVSRKNFIKQELRNVTTSSPKTTSTTNTPAPIPPISTGRKNGLLFPEITSIFFRKFNEIIARDREIFNRENNARNFRKDILLIPSLKNENASFEVPRFSFVNISLPFLKRVKRSQHEAITYAGVLNTHKNIKEKKVTYKEYFVHTPLAYYWPDLNADMVTFAVRVQELWQNGGISFLLPTASSPEGLAGLKAVITNTKYKYDVLPNEIVSVDGQGLHMATRTPCHTFFGEMLMRMQKGTDKLTVANFFTNMLSVFCRRGAIDSDYCKNTQIK